MVIVNKSLEEMLKGIGDAKRVFHRQYRIGNFIDDDRSHANFVMADAAFKQALGPVYVQLPISTAIKEAFDNAIQHGNQFDRKKNTTVDIYRGGLGWVVGISDEGKGFDYRKVLATESKKNFGTGFASYGDRNLQISFENQGRSINIRGSYGGIKR